MKKFAMFLLVALVLSLQMVFGQKKETVYGSINYDGFRAISKGAMWSSRPEAKEIFEGRIPSDIEEIKNLEDNYFIKFVEGEHNNLDQNYIVLPKGEIIYKKYGHWYAARCGNEIEFWKKLNEVEIIEKVTKIEPIGSGGITININNINNSSTNTTNNYYNDSSNESYNDNDLGRHPYRGDGGYQQQWHPNNGGYYNNPPIIVPSPRIILGVRGYRGQQQCCPQQRRTSSDPGSGSMSGGTGGGGNGSDSSGRSR